MFELHPGTLSLGQIKDLLESKQMICLSQSAMHDVQLSHQTLLELVQKNNVIYGVNTGFGRLAHQRIDNTDLELLQQKIVLSHACGVGEPLDPNTVKLILLLKINGLSRGFSGVSLSVIERLMLFYNEGVYPVIPSQGSVGASGDLAPLAHLAMCLIGEGEVFFRQKRLFTADVLNILNLQPLRLGIKEGLALLNGTQVSTAIALTGLLKIQRNFTLASIAGALSIEAFCGSVDTFDERFAILKNSTSQLQFSSVMRSLLNDSEIQKAQHHPKRVQDPYSLRCQPQVMGAVYSYIQTCGERLMEEANAVSDNPLIFSEEKEALSGGNFHAELTAFSADILAMIGAEIGAISERRIALLMDSQMSDLPAFLVANSGLNSGFMLAHVTASALASENKTFAHPASVDSLPTSANQEDHVSMATFSAMKLHRIADNVLIILAIETLAACQGIDFRSPHKPARALRKFQSLIRDKIPFYAEDRLFATDIEQARQILIDPQYFQDLREQLFYVL